jgi:hypothetical protein
MVTPAGFLLSYRKALFALFLVSNAIIASIAVWYNSLSETSGRDQHIGAYLIFLGVFAIAFIIPIIAIDILRRNAVPSRVWFECVWVGFFWVLELAGASAITASSSGSLTCQAGDSACTSSKVLIAFTWLCTITLLVHLLALPVFAVLQEDRSVWQTGVRHYPWFATRSVLQSQPSSPTRQWHKPLQLAAPRPTHPVARQAALLSAAERDVELAASAQRFERGYEAPRSAPMPPLKQTQPSLYPSFLGPHMPAGAMPGATTSDPLPPPLGDWPHSKPKSKGKRVPPPQVPESSPRSGTSTASSAPVRSPANTGIDPAGRPRPSHPRTRSNGSPTRNKPIPPPLDLTRISAYRGIEERLARK